MLQRSACSFAVILENQDIPKPLVLFQVEHSVAEGPEHIFYCLLAKSRKSGVVIGCFDDHLVSADSIHLVKQALALPIEISLDAQGWELVWDNSKHPTRRAAGTSIGSIRKNLRQRVALMAIAKRAKSPCGLNRKPCEVGRALPALCGDDHPPARDRIFSKFWQSTSLLNQRGRYPGAQPPRPSQSLNFLGDRVPNLIRLALRALEGSCSSRGGFFTRPECPHATTALDAKRMLYVCLPFREGHALRQRKRDI